MLKLYVIYHELNIAIQRFNLNDNMKLDIIIVDGLFDFWQLVIHVVSDDD